MKISPENNQLKKLRRFVWFGRREYKTMMTDTVIYPSIPMNVYGANGLIPGKSPTGTRQKFKIDQIKSFSNKKFLQRIQ